MTLLYHRLIHLFQGREYSNVGVSWLSVIFGSFVKVSEASWLLSLPTFPLSQDLTHTQRTVPVCPSKKAVDSLFRKDSSRDSLPFPLGTPPDSLPVRTIFLVVYVFGTTLFSIFFSPNKFLPVLLPVTPPHLPHSPSHSPLLRPPSGPGPTSPGTSGFLPVVDGGTHGRSNTVLY